MHRHLYGLALLAVTLVEPAIAQDGRINVETLTEQSQEQARVILRGAADALGGAERLLAINAIRVTANGKATSRLQSPSAAPPFEEGANEIDLLLDLEGKRLAYTSLDEEAGRFVHSRTIIGSGEPRIYNLHARTFRPFPSTPSFERELVAHSRRVPHLLLRQALADPLQLRALGEAVFEGRLHDVIAFTMADGVQVSIFVDRATGLVSKFETLYADILTGIEATETIFSDYIGEGVAKYPRSLRVHEAGQHTLRSQISLEIEPTLNERSFSFDATGYQPVRASQPYVERVEQLADGVFVLHSVSDPQHNALAVEFDSYVVVIDAPHSSEGGERLIRRINALMPGKPIRFVALTHHHADHIGGLRSFVASGAHVITTSGNREIVEALVNARHEDRLAANPTPLRLEAVQNRRRVISDGVRTLELIDIGPNPHAREMLVAYFPQERIIYQSDLFIVPSNEAPVGPPAPSLVSFGEAIDRLGLDVARIAGGHGRIATIEEFRERIGFRHPGRHPRGVGSYDQNRHRR